MDIPYSTTYEQANGATGGSSRALSVSAALAKAKTALEQCYVTLVGEVSELSNKQGYKAVYFTVKDDKASLPCMVWMNLYRSMGVELAVGSLVELTGRFTLYAVKGRMNFEVHSIKLAGEGNLRMQVANLARKLEAEGLMDPRRKRPVPKYPSVIGLVTSPRGAAVHDVLRTLRRRFPMAQVNLAGVPVEGRDAPAHLIEGLRVVTQSGAEVILLVRGGGSYEDLMPFNDEALARAIALCPVPVVTGIGHEPDTCIADMVADKRASTPTGAAEAISPKKENLEQGFENAAARMTRAVQRAIGDNRTRLEALSARQVMRDPNVLLSQEWQTVDSLRDRLQRALPQGIERDRSTLESLGASLRASSTKIGSDERNGIEALSMRLQHATGNAIGGCRASLSIAAARLNDLSPLTILSRGYAIARKDDRTIVRSVDDVATGESLHVRVHDGEINCTVTQ